MAEKIFNSEGIVLMKQYTGEANASVLVFTSEYGLVRLRAQSARRSTGKLRYALEPMTLGYFSFVRGSQANRLIGAEAHTTLLNPLRVYARRATGNIGKLLLRLMPGEEGHPELFSLVKEGFQFMAGCEDGDLPEAECLLVLSLLSKLGYLSEDATLARFAEGAPNHALIAEIRSVRPHAVRTINHVLSLSGL